MTKSNNEWVPEIGEKFAASLNGSDDILEGTAVCYDEGGTVFRTWKGNYHNTNYCSMYRPIKTEAEKRREELTGELWNELDKFFEDNDCVQSYDIAQHLVERDWIKPKPLTDDVIERLIDKHQNECETLCSFEFARMVEAYIRGETL